jgi:hypothetical protein
VLPRPTGAILGVEDDKVPDGHEARATLVVAGGPAGLATADDRDVNALAHVSTHENATRTVPIRGA